jgi:Icc-related predicted phosphoesterase
MLCGDLTGKTLVPFIRQENGKHKVFYLGHNLTLSTQKEITEVESKLAGMGSYFIRCNQEEISRFKDNPGEVEAIIKEEAGKRLKEWLNLLFEKIDTNRTIVIVMPGNDDDYSIDTFIQYYSDKGILWCLDRVVEIDGVEIISLAHVNPTPWNTPREANDKKISEMIESLIIKLNDPSKAIFNFHCPPHNTRIDLAPELDKSKKPVLAGGQVSYIHVGSKSVRRAIEKYQPLLGLHGHVHESPGVEKIANTICINPGSEYGEGILRGYIIEIDGRKDINYWKVEG